MADFARKRWLRVAAVIGLLASSVMAQGPAVIDQRPYDLAGASAGLAITEAAQSSDPYLRANAIESSQRIPERAAALVPLGLEDSAAVVRFASLVVMGKLNLLENLSAAEQLLNDNDDSVRAAAIFALNACGRKTDLTPLAGMLCGDHYGTRANVAMLLGEIGDSSAIDLLKLSAHVPMTRASAQQAAIVRLQIAEAIVKLGDDSALDAIRSGLFSTFGEVQALAATMLGRIGDRQMQPALENMLTGEPIEVSLAAAGALAEMGKPRGESMVIEAAGSEMPLVRSQAALVLGMMPGHASDAALSRLMSDRAAGVRLAAAAALARRP